MKQSTNFTHLISSLVPCRRSAFLLLVFFLMIVPAQAVTRYVKPGGNDSNTGTSWDQAYLTLQKALDVSTEGDQIWVAAGTYQPTKDVNGFALPADRRTRVFKMKNGVSVYGGFEGTETTLDERDYVNHVTILSGDRSNDDNNNTSYINFETDPTRDDNNYNVVIFPVGVTISAVLDGFTVTKGQASINDFNYGGAGVIIYASGGNAGGTVRNCIISRCFSGGKGGGLLLSGNGTGNLATGIFHNLTFSQNRAVYGGGSSCDGGFYGGIANGTYTDCTWEDSYSSNFGLGHVSIEFENGVTTSSFTGCTFRNHSGNVAGEVMHGGGVCVSGYNSTTPVVAGFTDCTFYNNRGLVGFSYGGGIGIYTEASAVNLTVDRSTFVGNVATTYGGAISNIHQSSSIASTLTVTNCFFSGNTCNASNGGHTYGGSISAQSTNHITTFTNCTFTGNGPSNTSPVIGAINGTMTIKNILLYGNTSTYEIPLGPNVTYSLVESGYPGTANLNANPNFIDANGPDNIFGTLDDNPAITACSPAINAGTNSGAPAVDIDGNPRPYGATTDIGCLEVQSDPIPAPTTAQAGPDQAGMETCGLTQVTLAANTPAVGTGAWSIASGIGGSFDNAASPTATFTGTAGTTYTLHWTISSEFCTPSTDEMVVIFNRYASMANAGPDQTGASTCGVSQVTLAANAPAVGTGIWTVVSGSGGSFSNNSNRNATFTGLPGNTYTLRWTVTSSPCSISSDEVVITFNRNPSNANAGPNQSPGCGITQVTLAATNPSVGTGVWSVVSGIGGSFGNAFSRTSTFTGNAGTAYTLRWTVSNDPCTATTDDVVITFSPELTPANAGPDQTDAATCGLTQVTLAANTPAVGTGSWSVMSGAGGSFGSASSPNSTFAGTPGTTYTLRWTISNSPCTPSTDDVVIAFNPYPTTANAGADQSPGCGMTQVTLAANSPAAGIGEWSVVSGSGGSFGDAFSPVSTFTGIVGSSYILRWTVSNNPCTASTDEVSVTFTSSLTTANAGPDQTDATTCGLTQVTLAANMPLVGTGAWSVMSGTGGSFGDASSPTSTFAGMAGSTYTLRWTVSGSPCTESTDDVVVTFNAHPSAAAAGLDQTGASTCGLTQVTLAASTPTAGSGMWTIQSGTGGSLGNAGSATSTFTGTAGSTYTLRWTVSNSPCVASTDEMVVTFHRNPTTAAAGPDQMGASTCGQTQVTLAANAPTVGTGQWSIQSGTGGSFGNASSATSSFTGTAGSTYTLRWTISNSPCAASTDEMVVTFQQNPGTAAAGSDATVCGSSINLSGNTPTIGTGTWTLVSGPGTVNFGAAGSPTSGVTVSVSGVYTFRWTISNAPCTASTDDVTITFTPSTTTIAAAGPDQNGASTCGQTQVTLAANAPTVGTGQWSIQSGAGGSLGNASSPTSTFTGTAGSTYTLRWTISNPPCSPSTDEMVVTFQQNPTTAAAGSDASLCGLTATLGGNTASTGTGTWTLVNGPGTPNFTNANTATSGVTVSIAGVYIFRWTIANAPCTASSDDVTITFVAPPTVAAAGPDQTGASTCGLTQVTLAANSPTVGTGQWTIQSGTGGSFGNAANATSTFTGTAGSTYTLRWTVSNSPCAASTDEMVVTFNRNPTTAAAGPDQTGASTCGQTQVTLAANAPTVGTGQWSIQSGTGGSLGNASSPTSTFTGVAGNTYTLRWTISNSPCAASTDEMVVTFQQNPGTAAAGSDATVCGSSINLSGNTPTIGTGTWTLVSGPGTANFGAAGSPTSGVTVSLSGVYTFRWTISNAPCTASTDDVTITFTPSTTTIAAAGPDQNGASTCGQTQVTLAANTPTIGTGQWSIQSGTGGSLGNAGSPTSTFTGTAGSTYTLRWTISNPPCSPSTDEMVVTFNLNPTTATAGPDQISGATCGLSQVTLAANLPAVGTGQWSIQSGTGGSFGNVGSPTSTFNGVAGNTYTLRWTISTPPCSASTDEMVVTFHQIPTMVCPANTTVCPNAPAFPLTGGSPQGGIYSGLGVSSGHFNPVSAGTGVHTILYSYTSGAGCSNSCSFNIAVQDLVKPVINCPANTTIAAGGACSSPLGVYTLVSKSDNCATNITEWQSPASTTVLTGHNTAQTVTLTASDGNGNSESCSFMVTLKDATAPDAQCKAAALQIPAGLTATLVVVDVDNNSTDNCGIASRSLNATSFNCSNLGSNTVTLTVTDVNGLSGTCTAIVTVTDPNSYCCAGPVAICKAATVALNSSGSGSIAVAAVNNNSTYDCGLSSMTVSPNTVNCSNIGSMTVTLTVTDLNNHSSQCTATVTVTDPILPSIVCPSNLTRNTDANQCTAMVTYASPTFSDNCSGVTLTRTSGPASGLQFSKGTTMVNWRATDLAGNSSVCGFTVTVNDNQVPTITCPANQTKNTDAGQCTAVATYVTPLATDNCTGVSATQFSGLASGSAFPKGSNAIVWQATDGSGLTSRCTFTITVNDNQAPVITCPGNQTKSTDAGLCTAVVTYTTPTFTDNCAGGSVTLQSGLASGLSFPKGMTTVVWRATDAAGLTKTCLFKVTINDSEAPVITCPANQAKTTDAGLCTAVATYNLATFTDNCTGGSVVKLSGLNSGSAFPKGTNQVVFKTTDAAGNQSLCTMTVTVTDAQLPTVTCPANIAVMGTITSGVCSATVNYTNPVASDNCALQSSFLLDGLASGSVFPAGVTTNVWRATDEGGLTATCAFTVTVECATNSSSEFEVRSSKFEMPTLEHGSSVNMRLAPNPATTEVQISLEGLPESGGQFTVFDAQGRVVWQQSNVLSPTTSINVSDLPSGLYQVRLQTEHGVVTKGLVVGRL